MLAQPAAASTDAGRRADIIYAQARSQIDLRLWRAALTGAAPPADATTSLRAAPLAITTMMTLAADAGQALLGPGSRPAQGRVATAGRGTPSIPYATTPTAISLGGNARYTADITKAAGRAGIPATALAAIIDAESAKNSDGSWRTGARNGRSSAAGLGQFLSGTWKAEAERAGTWLNTTAHNNDWIGADGKVLTAARAELLGLRDNAEAAINATADYASHNLKQLAAAGVAIGTTAGLIARAAYLGHNLGVGDAIRFLSGEINEGRARLLLDSQIGVAKAGQRIMAAGSAVAAHRNWLTEFIGKRVDPSRFVTP